MNISENLLFEKDLLKLQSEYNQLMEQEIRDLTNEYILSADIDEIGAYLVEKFGLDIPVLSNKHDVLPLEPVQKVRLLCQALEH